MTLTKVQITETIAEQNGFPKNLSAKIVETLMDIIKAALRPVRMF